MNARTLRQLVIESHAREVGERKIDVAAEYKDEFDRADAPSIISTSLVLPRLTSTRAAPCGLKSRPYATSLRPSRRRRGPMRYAAAPFWNRTKRIWLLLRPEWNWSKTKPVASGIHF